MLFISYDDNKDIWNQTVKSAWLHTTQGNTLITTQSFRRPFSVIHVKLMTTEETLHDMKALSS